MLRILHALGQRPSEFIWFISVYILFSQLLYGVGWDMDRSCTPENLTTKADNQTTANKTGQPNHCRWNQTPKSDTNNTNIQFQPKRRAATHSHFCIFRSPRALAWSPFLTIRMFIHPSIDQRVMSATHSIVTILYQSLACGLCPENILAGIYGPRRGW